MPIIYIGKLWPLLWLCTTQLPVNHTPTLLSNISVQIKLQNLTKIREMLSRKYTKFIDTEEFSMKHGFM